MSLLMARQTRSFRAGFCRYRYLWTDSTIRRHHQFVFHMHDCYVADMTTLYACSKRSLLRSGHDYHKLQGTANVQIAVTRAHMHSTLTELTMLLSRILLDLDPRPLSCADHLMMQYTESSG